MKQANKNIIRVLACVLVAIMLLGVASCGLTDISQYVRPNTDDVYGDSGLDGGTASGGGDGSTGTPGGSTPDNSGAGGNPGSDALYILDLSVVNGELIATMSDGTSKNLGAMTSGEAGDKIYNVTENNVTIQTNGTDATTASASKAILSAVGIECTFNYKSSGIFGGTTQGTAGGSGVIYRLNKAAGDAYIITNFHVVYDASSSNTNHIAGEIVVYMLGGSVEVNASYVGGSAKYDIAVLRVSGSEALRTSPAREVELSDSVVSAGMPVMAVGNANGGGISVTKGIVSVDSEHIAMQSLTNASATETTRVIRVDAPVNPGNSGGGLFDAEGRLVGIVNAKIVDEETEGMGYSIPLSIATTVADKAIEGDVDAYGNTRRVTVGVTVMTQSSSLVYDTETGVVHLREVIVVAPEGSKDANGQELDSITAGGLADRAGLQSGDIFVSVQVGSHSAKDITRQYHVIDEVLKAREGDTITFVMIRDGAERTFTIVVPDDFHR